MLCPTRFVVDGTENRIEEAWWPKCASLRLVYDSAFFVETIMHVYVRTIRTTKYIQRKTKKESPIEGEVSARTYNLCANVQGVSIRNGETAWTLHFGAKTCTFYAVACDYMVLV